MFNTIMVPRGFDDTTALETGECRNLAKVLYPYVIINMVLAFLLLNRINKWL